MVTFPLSPLYSYFNVHLNFPLQRNACLEDVKKIKHFAKIADIRDFVTDQFLCTGGIDPVVDPQTCGRKCLFAFFFVLYCTLLHNLTCCVYALYSLRRWCHSPYY